HLELRNRYLLRTWSVFLIVLIIVRLFLILFFEIDHLVGGSVKVILKFTPRFLDYLFVSDFFNGLNRVNVHFVAVAHGTVVLFYLFFALNVANRKKEEVSIGQLN